MLIEVFGGNRGVEFYLMVGLVEIEVFIKEFLFFLDVWFIKYVRYELGLNNIGKV